MKEFQYLPIIGMEIHVEPKTSSKMFCGCDANHFNVAPNTHTCPVCLGLPGALPIPNQKAINACIKLGLALNCNINKQSKFDRKNYFYPDLPKAYQISQYDLPFAYDGTFAFPSHISSNDELIEDKVGIIRIHMEEDTGKLQHTTLNNESVSLVDYNRSGVPLIEIVTKPDIHSAMQAKQFLKWLVQTITFLNISDCNMETGALRLEANISVAKVAHGITSINLDQLPQYKVEVKNVNSFRYIEKAIEYEIDRQIKILDQGKIPTQETRGFNENKGITFSQRTKETAQDYRYFPEPDIPPINTSQAKIDQIKSSISSTPYTLVQQLLQSQVRLDYAQIILQNSQTYNKFLEVCDILSKQEIKQLQIAKIIVNQKINLITQSTDEIITLIKASEKKFSISQSEITKVVDIIISTYPQEVLKYKQGKTSLVGFFIGQVQAQTKGQADPKLVSQILLTKLS